MIWSPGTIRGECVLAGKAVKVKGVDHPGLGKRPLAMGTWNVTLLGGRSLRLYSRVHLSAQLGFVLRLVLDHN